MSLFLMSIYVLRSLFFQLFQGRTLVLTMRSRRGVRIKATSEVENSCSTSEISSSDVEFESSKGSVL